MGPVLVCRNENGIQFQKIFWNDPKFQYFELIFGRFQWLMGLHI